MRRPRSATVLLGPVLAVAALSGCSLQNAGGTASAAVSPTGPADIPGGTPGSASPPAVGSGSPTPSPTVTGSASLAGVILAAPAGYHVSDDPDADAGALTSSDFDGDVGQSGAARRFGFVDGRTATYDEDAGDTSIEAILYRFDTSTDAAGFQFVVAHAIVADGAAAPRSSDIAGLPGAVLVAPTVQDSKDGDEYTAVVRRGTVVLVIDLIADTLSAERVTAVAASARIQYARLAALGQPQVPGI